MSWATSTWDWLTGQDDKKQAEAYYAKEKETFHKLVLAREAMDRWQKANPGKKINSKNIAALESRVNRYKRRQGDLKAKADKIQTQGYLASFGSFITKWIGSTHHQIGVIPLIPLVAVCLTAGLSYVAANYIKYAKESESDKATAEKLIETYKITGDKEILKAVSDITTTRNNDEKGLFGRVMSAAKTAGNVLLIGGIAFGALWLYNNNTVRSAARAARDGATRLRDEAVELRANI